jgi:hypothetical protein
MGDEALADTPNDDAIAHRKLNVSIRPNLHQWIRQREDVLDPAIEDAGEVERKLGRRRVLPGFDGVDRLAADVHTFGQFSLRESRGGPKSAKVAFDCLLHVT